MLLHGRAANFLNTPRISGIFDGFFKAGLVPLKTQTTFDNLKMCHFGHFLQMQGARPIWNYHTLSIWKHYGTIHSFLTFTPIILQAR